MKLNRIVPKVFFSRTIFVLIFSLLTSTTFAADFFVAPNGNDANPGSKEEPFATLEQAKRAVELRIEKGNEQTFTIWLAGGVYEISEPVVFQSTYFKAGTGVEIKAMENAKPVISGGIALENWTKNKLGLWEAQLPEKGVDGSVRELFIDGKRAVRARVPNSGYLRVKKVGSDRRTNFSFEKGDFPIPENAAEVELVFLHDWSISRIAVKNIDSKKRRLTTVDWVGARMPAFFSMDNWEPNPRYFLENAIEFIDADYEWVFDTKNRKVILKLPENIHPETVQIVVPQTNGLIEITGTEKFPANRIRFEGIAFKYCAWQIPEAGYCGVQACFHDARPAPVSGQWAVVPAAVKVEWAENCTFGNCSFENLGTSGVWLSTGTKQCRINNSVFNDISANGIMIGEGHGRFIDGEVWWKKVPEQTATGNRIENCRVTNCGAQFFGAIGIWCGITAETTIENCEIANLPYSGISIGWEWSPAETPCRANVVDGNHIHHVLKKLSDGGGIYMLGLQPGSKLVNNQIHDVKINAGRAESNGMFLDEGTTDVIVANNLIYNIAKSPLRFHRATTNLVKDNFLFCTGKNPPIRYNRTEETDIRKVNNEVYNEADKGYSERLEELVNEWK